MEMTEEEFDTRYKAALDSVLEAMAENSEVDVKQFYSLACVLENISFFSPVFYGIIQNAKKK
ncbi:hypothetical protein H8S95_01460 [Pontibacter sp. KCTC 32443]|nr:hypothetical protein [Pontibacter sp. KCTC 32443]